MKEIKFQLTDKEYEKVEKFFHDTQKLNGFPGNVVDIQTFIKEIIMESIKGLDISNIGDLMQQMKNLMANPDLASLFDFSKNKGKNKTEAKESGFSSQDELQKNNDQKKYRN